MAAIQTQELVKVFGRITAVDGLTLTVPEGSVFGFLGSNGAGKTTTIRLLTGMATPTAGSAQVAGETLDRAGRVRARVGYLPEEPAFYPWMNALEFLDHVGRLFGLDSADRHQRSRRLIDQVGLSEAARRRVGGFSRGMRQRLGLAQALINQPEVLFLDEPVSALDPAGRKEVLDLISTLRGQCTVFMSTHILADVERVCDRVGIIDRGKLIEEASRTELLERYTIPAFELECDHSGEALFKAWLEHLQTLAWVVSVQANDNLARVIVKDLAFARKALWDEVVREQLPLRRYEIVTPSLEDVFLRVIGAHQRSER